MGGVGGSVSPPPPPTLLVVSGEDGTPYLAEAGSSARPGPSVPGGAEDGAMMAVGVLGEDGRRIRFCEHDDGGGVGEGTGDGSAATIGDKLGRGISAEDDDDLDDDDDDDGGDDDVDDHDDEDDDEDGGGDQDSGGSLSDEEILRELGFSEDIFAEEDNGNEASSPPNASEGGLRSFRILWDLLARWATPSTVDLVLDYQRGGRGHPAARHDRGPGGGGGSASDAASPSRNDVDVGASRRAGIMSMLRMHVPRSLAELGRARGVSTYAREDGAGAGVVVVDRKSADQRLADLVRTFDPAVPAANLNTKMWRGLTTILIAIAFPVDGSAADDRIAIPPSVLPLDMTVAEYRYLTRSVFTSLSSAE